MLPGLLEGLGPVVTWQRFSALPQVGDQGLSPPGGHRPRRQRPGSLVSRPMTPLNVNSCCRCLLLAAKHAA